MSHLTMRGKAGLAGALWLLALACKPSTTPGPLRPVTIGCGKEMLGGLVFLAEQRQLFQPEGLAAEVRRYPSGKLALEALLRGEVTVAACASAPFAFAATEHSDLRILAVIATSVNEVKIVARRDHGIAQRGDLRGHKIGTQKIGRAHV